MAACGDSSDEATTQPSAVEMKTKGTVPENLSFTSGIFANEYLRDGAAADANFKGKLVELTGPVSTFGTNKDNVAYLDLQGTGGGDSGGSPIQCVFTEPGPKDAFSDLMPGLPTTVQGIVEGYADTVKDEEGQIALFNALGEIVTLSDCLIVP